jgi:hypothetical protein
MGQAGGCPKPLQIDRSKKCFTAFDQASTLIAVLDLNSTLPDLNPALGLVNELTGRGLDRPPSRTVTIVWRHAAALCLSPRSSDSTTSSTVCTSPNWP